METWVGFNPRMKRAFETNAHMHTRPNDPQRRWTAPKIDGNERQPSLPPLPLPSAQQATAALARPPGAVPPATDAAAGAAAAVEAIPDGSGSDTAAPAPALLVAAAAAVGRGVATADGGAVRRHPILMVDGRERGRGRGKRMGRRGASSSSRSLPPARPRSKAAGGMLWAAAPLTNPRSRTRRRRATGTAAAGCVFCL